MKFGMVRLKNSLLIIILASLLSGCTHDSMPVQFYMLTADTGGVSNTSHPLTNQGPLIGLGPIRIPEYLSRPQMVVATSDNQYQLSEDHRWAERLDQNISLALFKVLPGQLGTDRVVRYPWSQRQVVDYQVGIDILEFDVNASGQSRLIAQWFVKGKEKIMIDKRSVYQFPASTTDYALMVKAQSQCLAKLGEEIATTLRPFMKSVEGK